MSEKAAEAFELDRRGHVDLVRFTSSKLGTEAREKLYEVLQGKTRPKIILNFDRIRVLSSAPIGMLVNFQKNVEASGGSLVLCELDPIVRDILRLTHVEGLFTIRDSEKDALDSFSAP
jgi:anti-sigma B factor antagonist